MAKRRIIWTKSAVVERREILEYWADKTKSKRFSRKLDKLFIEAVNILSEYPKIGRLTNDSMTRIRIVRDYLIFYDFNDTVLVILSIWDARRDDVVSDFDYS